ncbi:MAG: PDZ domain-containing protein [Fimbriimonadaceae bacterium]|nr:PDZ domain-containing protein [Fimbriimonadaceae bacterium]
MILPALVALALSPQAPVEVPFRIGDNAIIVDALVNGRTVALMFDTGFSGDVVVNDALNIGPPSGELELRDFVGTFTARTVAIRSLRLGPMNLDAPDLEAVQQPMMHMSLAYGTHTDGILGYGPVAHQVFEINFQTNKFIFHPQSYDITKKVPDGKRTFLARMLPIGRNSIELEVKTAEGRRMVLALDTGNGFYATTHRDVLERVGLWDKSRTPAFVKASMVASGPVDSWYKRVQDVTIYGVPVKESYWDIIDMPSSSAEGDGTVGFGFLKNFNIVIDYERRRVWLDNFTGVVANEPAGGVGMSIAMDEAGKRARVMRIAPGGPAEKAGIQRGDAILSINGTDLTGFSHDQLDALMEGKVGSTIELAVSSSGIVTRHTLTRVALVND